MVKKNRIESRVTQAKIKNELYPLSIKYKTNTIYTKPVDLAFLMVKIGIYPNLKLVAI